MNRDFTDTELTNLFRTLRDRRADLLARRDLAWMQFLNETGMRIGEFAQTTKGDARRWLAAGRYYVPADRRKGVAGKQGTVRRPHDHLLNKDAQAALKELLTVSDHQMRLQGDLWDDDCRLVVSRRGTPLAVRSFQQRLADWAELAGLPAGVSPHWFRHTKAQRIKANTTAADPYDQVAYALGQTSTTSSRLYSQPSRSELEAEAARLEGQGRPSRRQFLKGIHP
ncbi:Tyrosine recombinase XerC [Andreprevotia sp. IGB-42]|uniref:tyrosine-type recombinase/integrase n=1 Tax=Andreprevotia sp. IGB-42 TaxID=2497473 RepID=UPI00135889D9|nr:tyrosine-type recombinase/integrase [Andreprevotia sp. IGB-42]KAF0812772.1 Tyrosine recombinase XerC [Andreprevotia sp. IGB-42]